MSSTPDARPPSSWPLAALPDIALGEARAQFFADNNFGLDGGYDAPYQDAVLAGIPYRTPNGPARADALRRHDLHHLMTGYATDWLGEARISAWELGSGGPGWVLYAWTIALWGLFTGLMGDPVGMLRAFVRGRGSDNLFAVAVNDTLLQRSVSELGRALQVRIAQPSGTVWHASVPWWQRGLDVVAFSAWSISAITYATLAMPGILVLALGGMLAKVQLHQLVGCPLRTATA